MSRTYIHTRTILNKNVQYNIKGGAKTHPLFVTVTNSFSQLNCHIPAFMSQPCPLKNRTTDGPKITRDGHEWRILGWATHGPKNIFWRLATDRPTINRDGHEHKNQSWLSRMCRTVSTTRSAHVEKSIVTVTNTKISEWIVNTYLVLHSQYYTRQHLGSSSSSSKS